MQHPSSPSRLNPLCPGGGAVNIQKVKGIACVWLFHSHELGIIKPEWRRKLKVVTTLRKIGRQKLCITLHNLFHQPKKPQI